MLDRRHGRPGDARLELRQRRRSDRGVGTSIEGVYAHEAGHNYGFQHANARYSGSSLEYYGIYDVMGFALPSQYNMLTALSTPYRVFQGITVAGEIQDRRPRQRALVGARHRDDQTAQRHTGLRSVRVKDPDTGEALYLDYRSGTGQDTGAAYAGGGSLVSGSNLIFYAPGVTINAARRHGRQRHAGPGRLRRHVAVLG